MSSGTLSLHERTFGLREGSTTDQTLDVQTDALTAAGCSRVWAETASGSTTAHPELTDLFTQLREGDTLVVWRLDRLGRNLPHLLQTVEGLEERGVGFRSMTEAIVEFERNLIRERTQVRLGAARSEA